MEVVRNDANKPLEGVDDKITMFHSRLDDIDEDVTAMNGNSVSFQEEKFTK